MRKRRSKYYTELMCKRCAVLNEKQTIEGIKEQLTTCNYFLPITAHKIGLSNQQLAKIIRLKLNKRIIYDYVKSNVSKKQFWLFVRSVSRYYKNYSVKYSHTSAFKACQTRYRRSLKGKITIAKSIIKSNVDFLKSVENQEAVNDKAFFRCCGCKAQSPAKKAS